MLVCHTSLLVGFSSAGVCSRARSH